MLVSQKCQYALRAVFELAKHYGGDPVKVGDIADAQAIPPRFLEVILNQLKQAGFVESKRGAEGGYRLIHSPESLNVGDILRFVQGPIGPVGCVAGGETETCPLRGSCVFMPMWKKVQDAMTTIYDSTTLQHLLNEEAQACHAYVPSYVI